MTEEKRRTALQNRSLYSSLDAYAEELNDAGFEYYTFVEKLHSNGVSTPWTKESIKGVFDIITNAMYGKSSSQLTTKELGECWKVFETKMVDLSGVLPTWRVKRG